MYHLVQLQESLRKDIQCRNFMAMNGKNPYHSNYPMKDLTMKYPIRNISRGA